MFFPPEPIRYDRYSLHLLIWDHRQPEAIAVSPDGRLLATSFDDSSDIIIWLKNDVGRWEPVRSTSSSCQGLSLCTRLLFSHDSRRLFTGWSDHGVLNWRIDVTGELTLRQQDILEAPDLPPFRLTELAGFWKHDGHVAGLSCSPNGRLLCSRSINGEVFVSEILEDGIYRLSEESLRLITQALFLPDGKLILADMKNGLLEVRLHFAPGEIDLTRDRTAFVLPRKPFQPAWEGNHCTALAVSPDGQRLAAGFFQGQLVMFERDAEKGWREMHRAGFRHSERVNALSFSPDGSLLASGSSDSTVQLWDGRSGQHRYVIDGFLSNVWQLQFNPADGRELIVATPKHDLNEDVKAVSVLTLGPDILPDQKDPLYPGGRRPDWLPLV